MNFERRNLLPTDKEIEAYEKNKLTPDQVKLKELLYALSDYNNDLLGGNIPFRRKTWTKLVNWFITEILK